MPGQIQTLAVPPNVSVDTLLYAIYQAVSSGGGGAESSTNLAYSASLTPDCNDGLARKITLTGDVTLNPPTNPTDRMTWEGIFLASGSDRTITLNAAIKIPSNFTGFVNPTTITQNSRWLVQVRYNSDSSSWWLTSWMGGFA